MPQRGGLRLAVFALTCAVGLAAAGSASANEVTLWACHAPDGTPLGAAPFGGAATFGGGCDTAGTDFDAGGVRTVPGQNGINVSVPPGLTLKKLMLTRRVTGLGSEGPSTGSYSATFRWSTVDDHGVTTSFSQVLDSADHDVSGDVSPDAPANPGRDRSVLLAMPAGPQGAAAEFQRVGLVVDDSDDPTAAVGGIGNTISKPAIDPNDPESDGYTHVAVWANDNGVGLWKADLFVDGQKSGSVEYVNAGNAGLNCVQALDAAKPLPLNNDCQHNGRTFIRLDSTLWADGPHTLAVKLYDASGRVADVLKNYATTFLNHPDPGNKTANLNIGSGNTAQQNGSNNGGNGSGGVAGESTTSCNSPRLSMELSQKPLKLSKGVPVLVSGKRYRFRGKLTCVINGKRRSALPKTPIELLNTIGKHTYRKGGATVRDKGAITLILAYKSSRTLVFRYTNPDGRRSQVKLKIKVVKKPR